ncbi:MAG: hypothetical protein HKM95_10445 [Inquilinus sp.]|nr:hypothetical protein [Inquilinus sp.]
MAIAVQAVNDTPIADAGPDQTLECTSPEGALVSFDGSGSSDVETPTLSLLYAWSDSFDPPLSGPMPSAVLGLGENLITLVVNDGQIDSAPDMVTVNVVDTTRPDLVASLTLVGEGDDNGDDDEGRFRIGVTAGDVCDSEPTVTAVLDIEGCPDISVADGQIIEFEFDDDECEVEWEDGILEIEAPALVLVATVIDGSGNTDEVVVLPMGLSDDNDNVAAADLDD